MLAVAPAAGAEATAEWQLFRNRFVDSEGRLIDTGNQGISHSEGQGWGLIFAAAVAAYADALRGGTHLGGWNWNDIARAAHAPVGADPDGERAEFAGLVDAARALTDGDAATVGIAGND